jgi:hypothetical protein
VAARQRKGDSRPILPASESLQAVINPKSFNPGKCSFTKCQVGIATGQQAVHSCLAGKESKFARDNTRSKNCRTRPWAAGGIFWNPARLGAEHHCVKMQKFTHGRNGLAELSYYEWTSTLVQKKSSGSMLTKDGKRSRMAADLSPEGVDLPCRYSELLGEGRSLEVSARSRNKRNELMTFSNRVPEY